MRRPRALVLLALLATLLVAVVAPGAGLGVSITVVYDADAPLGVDPCDPAELAVCSGGIDRTAEALGLVRAAADHWEDVIEDDHAMTIRLAWLDPAADVQQDPFVQVVSTDDDGRVLEGRMYLLPGPSYYFDATPADDGDFLRRRRLSSDDLDAGTMRPKLLRTLHPDERVEAFQGAPPEVLEVGYNGLWPAPGGNDPFDQDLFTIAVHEVGHLMGLARPVQGCVGANAVSGYVPPGSLTGGAVVGIVAFPFTNDEDEQVTDCAHLDAGGITACKPDPADDPRSPEPSTRPGLSIHDCTAHQALMWPSYYPSSRARPSVTDILAVVAAEGWEEVDLPRKYSLGGGGAWTAAGTWLGDRAPDSGDDVYVVNQESPDPFTLVTSVVNRTARNLFVSDENRVRVTGSRLTVSRTAWLAGPDSREGPVRPLIPPPPPPAVTPPVVPSTLDVSTNGLVVGDRLGTEPGGRLLLRNGGRAQFGDVLNGGLVTGRGLLGVARSFTNGASEGSPSELADPGPASGVIRADGGLLRIVTPPGGGIVIDPPLVDLDGPAPTLSPSPPRVWAVGGDLEVDALVASGTRADIRVGSGRTLRLVRNGLVQDAQAGTVYALRLLGGPVGATFDAPPSTFRGTILVDGIGRFTGRTRLQGGASLRLDLGGTAPGTQHDQVQVQDVAELGGELRVSLTGGFVPAPGDAFTVMTYESRIGEFATTTLPALPAGLVWEVQYGATELRLVVVQAPPPPVDTDVDGDGDTDIFDLLALQQQFGPCPPLPGTCSGDLNGDGVVNNADVLIWLQNA